MEFLFITIILFTIFGLGLSARRYNARVRLMLVSVSAMAPLWFFIVWQGLG